MRFLRGIGKWTKLPLSRKVAWIDAAFVLFFIGIGLRLLSFSSFKKWYLLANHRFPRKPAGDSKVEVIVWAVENASRHLPMKLLCLPKALAVKYLLGSSDDVVIHIGFNKEPSKDFQFHAWVEKHGHTVIGSLPAYYQPLWVWN